MKLNNCELFVTVNGRRISEFPHQGQTFIEGRGGSNYEIEFRNSNNFRVEAILSVDGLSVTDGKPAGELSNGYIVRPFETIRVPGWTLNNSHVAAFTFSSEKGESYVEQSTGVGTNKGVIGALVYRERIQPPITKLPLTRGLRGFEQVYSSSADMFGSNTRSLDASIITASSGSTEESLGTAFGHATSFQTSLVSFERDSMIGMLVVYYDTLQNLKKRGVVIPPVYQATTPQAFPAMTSVGCTPPKDWVG